MADVMRNLLAAGLVAALAFGAWQWREASAERLALADYKAGSERQARQSLEAAVKDFRDDLKLRQEAVDAANTKREAAEADARRAVAAGFGLQQQLAATRAAYAAGPASAAGGGQAAGETIAVLTDLLGRCSERRRELALFADRAHGAGQLCERLSVELTD